MRRPFAYVIALTLGFLVAAGGCGDDNNNGDDVANPDAQVDGPPTNPDAPPVEEEVCETLAPVTTGTCSVTIGNQTQVLKGTVLTPTKIFRGGGVAIDATGQITCTGCGCDVAGATVISCPDAVISPGLINPHDHITYTQNSPYHDQGIRYEDRQQWRIGMGSTRPKIPAPGSATADQIRWGELRFVMGGATSIVGSGGQSGFARNLDKANLQEGLGQGAVDFDTFPLADTSGTKRTMDCNYGGSPTTAASIAGDDAYEPHTSEGIDATARNEFLCQSSADYDTMAPGTSNNLLLPQTAMIHAIGLLPQDYAKMAAAGTALIWSPRSNITLYGDTARVSTAAALGVQIALGTDWMPSGSMNLLRELKCASSYNATYMNHRFSDRDLWMMVTANAAAVTATDDVIGVLAPGKVADIAVFAAHGKTYGAVVDANPEDVMLVMRGGKTLYGEDSTVAALATNCDAISVCDQPKRACVMAEAGKTYDALNAAAAAYPAIQCGTPMNEPSCSPMRPESVAGSTIYTGVATADDSDGDGIPNATDKCPMMFDPIRPLDNGMQGDADGDGVGDACDPCPLNANTTTCTTVNPDDADGDMIPNSTDNCPNTANPDQADGDHDGKGDACDACPADANPGSAGCPTTIYAIKMGTTPANSMARVTNALVTGKGSNGFFLQVKPGDTGYTTAAFSGIFVFTSDVAKLANAVVGTRVTVDGTVLNFQGQLELSDVTAVTVNSATVEALPALTPTTYAAVKTGGPMAASLEGVLVSLGAATVTSVDTAFGEFTLTDTASNKLVVDDFLFAATPTVGASFSAANGILSLRSAGSGVSASKLLPRNAGDLVAGAPGLTAIGPALSYSKVGTVGMPTFPQPLTVTLSAPAQGATTVTLVSSDPTALTVANVTIPDGATSAPVPVTALTQALSVTVTATLGSQSFMTHVRVLGAAEVPTTVTLSPTDAAVAPNGDVTLTATLDIPAPFGGTDVALVLAPTAAGTLPATITVPVNQVAQTFIYHQTAAMGMATITATLGASTSTATIMVSTGASHLVINEIEYDEPSADTTEYVEIFNPSTAAVSLVGKQIILINGSDRTAYDTIDLAPAVSLPAGGYLILAGAGVSVTAPTLKIDTGWMSGVQNGAPDGIVLVDNTTHTVIDALSYEGDVGLVDLPGFPMPVSLVEGTTASTIADPAIANQSLCRSPNGQDTDHADVDWKICPSSPGTVNPIVP